VVVLGIDPGASGGLAWFHQGTVSAKKMPGEEEEILLHLEFLSQLSYPKPPVCFLEKLTGFVGRPNPGARMFKFGEGYGFLRGVLMTLRWEINSPTPQNWQNSLGIGKRGDRSPTEWKRVLKGEAQRLFPSQKVTLATADALLILKFGLEGKKINFERPG